ncbi:MAG: exosortase-associated EpsI family protein [Limisphaerales bacterium]
MKRQSWLILLAVWALLGMSATVILRLQYGQRLGRPGLKIAAQPIYNPRGKIVGDHSVDLPERVLNYTSQPAPITDLELGWLPKDTTYGRRVYHAPDGAELLLSVVLMGTDRTSIHKPQFCLTGQGWRIDRSEKDSIRIERPHPYRLPVMKLTTTMEVRANGQPAVARGLYVYWFVADGELTADHAQRMWWMARDLIKTGVLQRWAYVTCFAVCPPGGEEAAYERLKQFVAASVPEFQLASGADPDKVNTAAVTR